MKPKRYPAACITAILSGTFAFPALASATPVVETFEAFTQAGAIAYASVAVAVAGTVAISITLVRTHQAKKRLRRGSQYPFKHDDADDIGTLDFRSIENEDASGLETGVCQVYSRWADMPESFVALQLDKQAVGMTVIVQEAAPELAAVQEEALRQPIMQEEILHQPVMQEVVPEPVAVQEETPQQPVTQEETPQQPVMQEEAPPAPALQEESLQPRTPPERIPPSPVFQEEAYPVHRAIFTAVTPQEAPPAMSAPKPPVRREQARAQREGAPLRDAPRRPARRRNAPMKAAPEMPAPYLVTPRHVVPQMTVSRPPKKAQRSMRQEVPAGYLPQHGEREATDITLDMIQQVLMNIQQTHTHDDASQAAMISEGRYVYRGTHFKQGAFLPAEEEEPRIQVVPTMRHARTSQDDRPRKVC